MKTITYFLLTMISTLHAGLLPDYDEKCDFLSAQKVAVEKTLTSYFKEEVPRKIHRIWFGDPSKLSAASRKSWEEYAAEHGYEYHLWTEKDFAICQRFMEKDNYELMQCMIEQKNWWAAADILRLNLLKTFGGIYIDCDLRPPTWKGQSVDFFSLLSNQGLTLMTEHSARNIGTDTAVFVGNSLIASPKSHPVMLSATEQISANCWNFYEKKGFFDAAYVTGPFFLNKVLNGTYHIVPCIYLHQFNMY